MHVLQWSCRNTGQLDYKNGTELCFRESHSIQLRCPCKDPYHGDSLHHPDSNRVSCLTTCIVHASQYPNDVSCSVCKCLCNKLHQKQIKAFPMNDSIDGAVCIIHCHVPVLEPCSNKYFQQNCRYHLLNMGEKDLIDNWEDVR